MSDKFDCELHGLTNFLAVTGTHKPNAKISSFICCQCMTDAHAALRNGVTVDQFAFMVDVDAQEARWTPVKKVPLVINP